MQLVEAQFHVAGRTGDFALRTAETMRSPVLTHHFGGATASFPLDKVLVYILESTLRSNMSAK